MATMLESFESALSDNKHIEGVDAAVVQAGRSIAEAIDDVLASPTALASDKIKALYMTPHLISILRELLATPAARKTFGVATSADKGASRLTLIKDQANRSKNRA